MILQALKEYYDRKAADTDSSIAPEGWEWKEIPFIIVLNEDGIPIDIQSTIEGSGKNKTTKWFLLPQSVKRTVGIAAYLLWDSPEYALGIQPTKKNDKQNRSTEQHSAFKKRVDDLGDIDDAGYLALKRFLERPNKLELLETFDEWKKLIESGSFLTFKLAGTPCIISDSHQIRRAINQINSSNNGNNGYCLVSGEQDEILLTHASIKGVWGAQTAGGAIISFNTPAYEFYGKKQGENAPIGKQASFAFSTALNTMLNKGSKNRMQVGDASTVFWASKSSDSGIENFENSFAAFFSEPPKDNPDAGIAAVRSLFESVSNGAFAEPENQINPTRFYVLGLSPNSARISIRFFIVATVEEMAKQIRQHFIDTAIQKQFDKEPDYLSLFRLLASTAVQGKSENIPPNLAGEFMRSILEGTQYPKTLLNAVVRRIKAEREVTYPRAALLKAYLNRLPATTNNTTNQEIKEMLDETNTNIGYLLGRLFATLEKIQEEANPGLNATIRDRFYASASGTPSVVFSNLMRLSNHHLSKLDNTGRRVNWERGIGEIVNNIPGAFPRVLSLEDQGRFAIGYYHQRQSFYKKKTTIDTNTTEKI